MGRTGSAFAAPACFVALALALLPLQATADPGCARDTTAESNECLRAKIALADDDMGYSYQLLIDALTSSKPEEVENLRAAQRAWIGFRDADCHFAGWMARQGTMVSQLINVCVLERTEQRKAELDNTWRSVLGL